VVRLWITGANANGLKYITRGSYTGCTRNSRGKPTRDWFLSLSLSLSLSHFFSPTSGNFPKRAPTVSFPPRGFRANVETSEQIARACGRNRVREKDARRETRTRARRRDTFSTLSSRRGFSALLRGAKMTLSFMRCKAREQVGEK